MNSAYEMKALLDKFKGRGLDLAEEGAKIVIEEIINWLDESAKLSATPFDDIAAVIYPNVKKFALEAADKLDGAVG